MFMSYGAKFPTSCKYTANPKFKQFYIDLDIFIYKNSIDYNKPLEYFSYWKLNVLSK